MANENIVIGVPSTVLLPSKSRKWKHISGPHPIDVGFDDIAGQPLVSYDVASDVDSLFDLGSMSKAMYLKGVYPKLEDNQIFSIRNLIVDNTKKVVTVVGNVLESI